LRADSSVPYGEMMAILERLRAGGYLRVALVALDAGGKGEQRNERRRRSPEAAIEQQALGRRSGLALFLHVGGAVAALVTLRGDLDENASGAPASRIVSRARRAARLRRRICRRTPLDKRPPLRRPVAASEAKETNEERITHARSKTPSSHNVRPEKPIEEEDTSGAAGRLG
jgi:hypothetical protein